MHRVAAKIAQEVLVLFQHRDIDAGAGQQEAQHHPGRAAACNHACGGPAFHEFIIPAAAALIKRAICPYIAGATILKRR